VHLKVINASLVSKLGTRLRCSGVVKKVINYYTDRGSHVFACFVDLSKAFDRVNYWKHFNQLLSDGADVHLVKLLVCWYVNQEVSVRWLCTRSESFYVGNGTKQGGVLSPYLFTRYLSQLITEICLSRVGCKIGTLPTNILYMLTISCYCVRLGML